MPDRALELVRRKVVSLLRSDPPLPLAAAPGAAAALDRWLASRLSGDEAKVLFRLEHEYGEAAMAEWLAEALVEAGLLVPPLALAG